MLSFKIYRSLLSVKFAVLKINTSDAHFAGKKVTVDKPVKLRTSNIKIRNSKNWYRIIKWLGAQNATLLFKKLMDATLCAASHPNAKVQQHFATAVVKILIDTWLAHYVREFDS